MTTTTRGALAERLATEFVDGRQFDGHTPRAGVPAYRQACQEAIPQIVETYFDADITAYTDLEIGSRFDAALHEIVNEKMGPGWTGSPTTDPMKVAYGAWIRGVIVSPGNTEPEETVAANVRFPLPHWEDAIGGSYDLTGPIITDWASNDIYDIAPTVDQQANVIRLWAESAGRNTHAFASSTTDGPVKEFISAAMRHKTERLLPPGTPFTVKEAGEGGFSLAGIYMDGDDRRTYEYVVREVPGEMDRPPATSVLVEANGVGVGYVLAHHVVPIVSPGNVEETPTPEPVAETDPRDAEIERLRQQIRVMQTEGDRITEGILEEAEHRGWCSEYEDFVEGINDRLTYFSFQKRQQEFEVTISYTISDSGTYICTVTADDEDEALEQAREQFYDASHSTLWDDAHGSVEVEIDDTDVSNA